jgi:hypothetical protein
MKMKIHCRAFKSAGGKAGSFLTAAQNFLQQGRGSKLTGSLQAVKSIGGKAAANESGEIPKPAQNDLSQGRRDDWRRGVLFVVRRGGRGPRTQREEIFSRL